MLQIKSILPRIMWIVIYRNVLGSVELLLNMQNDKGLYRKLDQ